MKQHKKIHYNRHDLKVGTILIRIGTVTPETIELESEGFCEGWDRVRNSEAAELERSLRGSGWHMSYLADSASAVAIGTFDQETIGTAVLRLLKKLRPQMFNSVELTEVSAKRFAWIPYVHLTGHARHIQHEMQIDSFVSRRNEITRTALQARLEDTERPQHATAKHALARN
jgi:hypothetical protein